MKKYKKLVIVIGTIVLLALVMASIVAARSGEGGAWHGSAVIPQPDVTLRAYPSYAKDIQPIFNQFCLSCHRAEDAHNGLRLDNHESVMKGTQFGAVIVPGEPAMSPMLSLIRHETDPKIWMPYHQEQLSPNRIKNIENWIRYGARDN